MPCHQYSVSLQRRHIGLFNSVLAVRWGGQWRAHAPEVNGRIRLRISLRNRTQNGSADHCRERDRKLYVIVVWDADGVHIKFWQETLLNIAGRLAYTEGWHMNKTMASPGFGARRGTKRRYDIPFTQNVMNGKSVGLSPAFADSGSEGGKGPDKNDCSVF